MKIVPGNETGGADGPRVPRKSAGRNRRNGTGWCAIDSGESTPGGLPGESATLNHSYTSDKAVGLHQGRDCSWEAVDLLRETHPVPREIPKFPCRSWGHKTPSE